MKKLLAVLRLIKTFIWKIILSGIHTLIIILKHGLRHESLPPASFVRLPFPPMSEWGATLLGSMEALTPGTTTVDIDMEKHEMLLHVLDATSIDAIINDAQTSFENDLAILFGDEK